MKLGPKAFRRLFNFYPPYFFSRTRVTYIAPDWKEVEVKLHKSWLSRNYVGTTFGGTMYGAADPFFMLMLIQIMGIKDYIIWDKGAEIDFQRPARSTLTYRFVITDEDLKAIHRELDERGKTIPEFTVSGVDEDGTTCVVIKKTVYIRRKAPKSD